MPKLKRDHMVNFCGGFSADRMGIFVKKGTLCTILDTVDNRDDVLSTKMVVSCPLPNGLELVFTVPDHWIDDKESE